MSDREEIPGPGSGEDTAVHLEGERPEPLGLIDRPAVLALISEHLSEAWASFDLPRPTEPTLDPGLRDRLDSSLPGEPGDAGDALDDATRVLEASVSPARPLFAAYIGSTGLEAGVLAGALGAAYDVNLAGSAGAAELLEEQALRWMAEFVGYPLRQGVFTSGGMTSNLTALLAAREQALPGARTTGVAGRPAAVYCSAEAHHSVVRAVEVAGLGTAVGAADPDRRTAPDAGGVAGRGRSSPISRAGTRSGGRGRDRRYDVDRRDRPVRRDRRRLPVPRRLAARRRRLRRSGGRRAEPCAAASPASTAPTR